MPIDSCSGLGAEIAVTGVEIECTDSVFAADTLEKYSTFDPIGGVVSHGLIVVLSSEGRTHHGGLSKVISGTLLRTQPIILRDFCPQNSHGRGNALIVLTGPGQLSAIAILRQKAGRVRKGGYRRGETN